VHRKNKDEEKNMTQSEKRTKAFLLSLIAGILIVSNSALLGVVATWFPGVLPTLPGESANDTTTLYTLTAIGLMLGILVLLGVIMLHFKPRNKKIWGIIIIIFSIPSVVTGGGFIIGFILGIIGGVSAFSQKTLMKGLCIL
jgi:hypothetical protein